MGKTQGQRVITSLEAGMPVAIAKKRDAEPRRPRVRPTVRKPQAPDNDILLRELIHRIKNSLAIISSIANIEAQSIKDPEARESVLRLQSRVAATALLYDRLSTGAGGGTVRLDTYLGNLAELLVESLAIDPSMVELELDLEALAVSPKIAGALGLLVNEAITNSFKYGLATGRGRLRLSCRSIGRGQCRLLVSDDGPGFPPSTMAGEGRDFGFTLMALEAEELGGRLELEPGPGAAIGLSFPLPRRTKLS